MSKKELQAFIWIVVNSKGGVGKSFTAREFIVSMLHYIKKSQITLLFVDDNNDTPVVNSDVYRVEKHNVKDGIEASQASFFKVLNGEDVVVDAGGGNDTNFVIEGITKLELNEYLRFVIPVLKDEDDIENLIKTYRNIRRYAKDADITLVLNRASGNSTDNLKIDFPFLFKEEDSLSKDIRDIMFDKNVNIASIVETDLFPRLKVAGLKSSVYEMGSNIIDYKQKMKDAAKGKQEDFLITTNKIKFHKSCNEYFKSVMIPFFEKCGFKL